MSDVVAAVALLVIAASALPLLWMYVGYGLVIGPLSRRFGRPVQPPATTDWPTVSVLVMSYNEERTIRARLENLLQLEYPADKLELLVVDSASSDATRAIVAEFAPRVRLVAQAERRGKAAAIHEGVRAARGDIVVCTDANTTFKADILRQALPLFGDAAVGGVYAAMRQVAERADSSLADGGEAYWRYEMAMRHAEADLHSPISMCGEFTAFRRALVADVALDDWYPKGAADDFALSLYLIAGGHRIGCAPDAFASEPAPSTYADFASQKIRTTTQAIVTARAYRKLLGHHGWYGRFILPSRRVLPLFSPFLVLTLLAGVTALAITWPTWVTLTLLGGQLLFHACALLGATRLGGRVGPLRMIAFFHVLNFLALCAWRDFFRARNYTVWDKVQSTRAASAPR